MSIRFFYKLDIGKWSHIIIIINLFNVDINITIKNTSVHENKANRCQLKNKTVKNVFLKKALLYEDNQYNFASSC